MGLSELELETWFSYVLSQAKLTTVYFQIDLLLSLLSSVGFSLRENNPLKLKEIILKIQQIAREKASKETDKNFTKMKFTLDILTCIKHNNMKKIPNYDPETTRHFQNLAKSMVKAGRKSSDLNISLNDLLRSNTMGKWWIVGSAWTENFEEKTSKIFNGVEEKSSFDNNFLIKAQKLRLSRPPRINILHALTEGATDHYEAFNHLLQIKLSPAQEIEIFNVLLICNNKYKIFNEVYAKIAILLIKHRGKFRKLLQTTLWSTFKDLKSLKKKELRNLSCFLYHLLAEGALDLFILKEIDFVSISDIDAKFVRQVLKGILIHPTGQAAVEGPFTKLANSKGLKMLRDYLRIFISQYVVPKKPLDGDEKILLSKRAKLALTILSNATNRVVL